MTSCLDSCEDDGVRSGGKGGRIDYIEKKKLFDTHLERYRETHDDKKKKEASQAFLKYGTEDRRVTTATRREENSRAGPTEATKAARQGCL